MKTTLVSIVAVCVAASVLWPEAIARADGQSTSCTTQLTGFPVSISAPGVYCFTAQPNQYTGSNSGSIMIQGTGWSGHVTIDLNGYELYGAGTANVAGIYINVSTADVEIKNGSIRNFVTSINVNSAKDVRLKRVRSETATTGISLASGQLDVSDSHFTDYTTGISVPNGTSATLLRVRDTSFVASASGTYGVYIGGGSSALTARLDRNSFVLNNSSLAYGVYLNSGFTTQTIIATNNGFTGAGSVGTGIYVSGGIGVLDYNMYVSLAAGSSLPTAVKYRNSVAASVTTAYTGGTNSGNNN